MVTQDADYEALAGISDLRVIPVRPRASALRRAVGPGPDDGARVPVPRGSGLPPVAGAEGHLDAMAMYAGSAVGSVTDIRPAAEVVAELVAELERRLPASGRSGVR